MLKRDASSTRIWVAALVAAAVGLTGCKPAKEQPAGTETPMATESPAPAAETHVRHEIHQLSADQVAAFATKNAVAKPPRPPSVN